MTMTDSDKPQTYEKKVESIEDFYDMKFAGWHETQGKDGYWKMSKTGYFPVRIPQKLIKAHPSEFGEKIPRSPELLRKVYEQDEKRNEETNERNEIESTEESTEEQILNKGLINISVKQDAEVPLISLSTQDMLVHDPARILLQSIVLVENLHLIPVHQRHEYAFGGISLDGKGKPQLTDKFTREKEITFSLADLAIYKLVEHYVKAIQADETIISLNVEKMMIYNSYMQEKEKRKELEDALMLKMILKI